MGNGNNEEFGVVPYQSRVPEKVQGGWGWPQSEAEEAEFRELDDGEDPRAQYEEDLRDRAEDRAEEPEVRESWWERARAHNQAKWEEMASDAREDVEEQGSFRDRARARVEDFRLGQRERAAQAIERESRELDIQMGIEGRKSVVRKLKQSYPGTSRAAKFEKSANKYTGAMQGVSRAMVPPINRRAMRDIYVGPKDPKGSDVYIPRGMRPLTTPGTLSTGAYIDTEGLKSLTQPGGALRRASTPSLRKLTSPTHSMGASMLGQAAAPRPIGNFNLRKPKSEETLIGQLATGKIKPKKKNGAKNSYKKGTRIIKREERLY